MQNIFQVKEQALTDTPLLVFDCELANGQHFQKRLSEIGGTLGGRARASGTFVLNAGPIQPFDRVTLWYQNLAFDYNVPAGSRSLTLNFFAGNTGTTHSITVNGRSYIHVEAAGESGDAAGGRQAAAADAQVRAPRTDAP